MTTPVDLDELEVRAIDLIRELAPFAGDASGVSDVLTAHMESLEWDHFALVCIAALRDTFASCLTPTPVDQLPAGALTLTPMDVA